MDYESRLIIERHVYWHFESLEQVSLLFYIFSNFWKSIILVIKYSAILQYEMLAKGRS